MSDVPVADNIPGWANSGMDMGVDITRLVTDLTVGGKMEIASALEDGTTLPWILQTVADLPPMESAAPVLLMSYLNPIMAHGFDRFAADAARADVTGLIVPDLPLEECGELRLRERADLGRLDPGPHAALGGLVEPGGFG